MRFNGDSIARKTLYWRPVAATRLNKKPFGHYVEGLFYYGAMSYVIKPPVQTAGKTHESAPPSSVLGLMDSWQQWESVPVRSR